MNKTRIAAKAVATLLIGLGVASSAQAVWTFNTATSATSSVVTDPALNSVSGAKVTNGASDTGFSGGWTSGALTYYAGGGNGMSTGADSGAPTHAIDNNGNTEAMIIGFSQSVVLSSVGLGYATNSSGSVSQVDVSIFRWVGAATATTPALGAITGGAMAGWQLVGNYGDFAQDTSNPYNLVNGTGLGSSWWMISAYNSGFTGAGETRGTFSNGNDFFKVYAVAGSACTSTVAGVCGGGGGGSSVPEPGSLALAGLALFGVAATRRRAARQV